MVAWKSLDQTATIQITGFQMNRHVLCNAIATMGHQSPIKPMHA